VTCQRAGHLLDDYLDDNLSQGDRQFLEAHLERCPRCAEELRRRPSLERNLRRALAASVQPLALSTDASARIVDAAGNTLQRARRSQRVARSIRLVSVAVAVSLVAVGILFLVGEIPVPDRLKPVTLFPVNRLALADVQSGVLSAGDGSLPRAAVVAEQPLPRVSLLIEPRDMHPAQPFTMTVILNSAQSKPLDHLRLDLEVSGPAGYYSFSLALQGPFPAPGVSVLRLTPELLADACQDRYLMQPTELFRAPGTYRIRLTLFDAVTASP
jgi:hypothetical protein